MGDNETETRESLHLRVPAPLKRQVEEYARLRGISSVNAAACVLLAEGIRAERRRGAVERRHDDN